MRSLKIWILGLWVGAWIAFAGLLTAAGQAGPGAGGQSPAPLVADGIGSATLDGVTLRLVEASFSPVGTRVHLVAEGRPLDGQTVNLLERGVIRLVDGTELRESAGLVDGRQLFLEFPPVAGRAGTTGAVVEVRGLALSRLAPGQARAEDRLGIGSYRIELPPSASRPSIASRAALAQTVLAQTGRIELEEVIVDGGTVVIRARFRATHEEIQANVVTAQLQTAAGVIAPSSVRSGFGEDLSRVEMRFDGVGPDAQVELSLGTRRLEEFVQGRGGQAGAGQFDGRVFVDLPR